MSSSIPSPVTNRSIRSIRTELYFLAESNLLSPETLKQILSLLPEATPSKSSRTSTPTIEANDAFLKPSLPTRKATDNSIIAPSTPSLTPLRTPTLAPTLAPTPTPVPAPIPEPISPPSYDSSDVLLEALYDYTGTQADDLQFKVGDKIVLKQKLNNDWWSGRNTRTNREGMFPAQYVKISIDGKKAAYNDNMMVNVANQGNFGTGSASNDPEHKNKLSEHGKKFGSKLGNAAIFGAGATIGSNIVNSIL